MRQSTCGVPSQALLPHARSLNLPEEHAHDLAHSDPRDALLRSSHAFSLSASRARTAATCAQRRLVHLIIAAPQKHGASLRWRMHANAVRRRTSDLALISHARARVGRTVAMRFLTVALRSH